VLLQGAAYKELPQFDFLFTDEIESEILGMVCKVFGTICSG